MEHLGTNTIYTERLILRRFTISDADAMFRNWASDEEVVKFLMWPAHNDVEVSRNVLCDWTSSYHNKDYYQWAIVWKEIDEPIGSIAVVNQDQLTKKAHIGYCIGKQWWNMGIMSEALRAVIGYLFEEVGFSRIESRHDPRNPYSGKVMMRCGMKFEGTMRQSDWNNQGICDASWYSILRDEWNTV